MKKHLLAGLCVIGLFIQQVHAQDFYDINTIQKVEIFFSDTAWDFKMDTAKAGLDGYLLADSVRINGIKLDSVGVKYKGNSSYNSTYQKNPLHLATDKFKDQEYLGIDDIKLSNGYADPSMIREALAYAILKNYMYCSRANFARVYINGVYKGVYSNAEDVSKKFCATHFFGSKQNTFIKCNPVLNPSPSVKSNLKYISADSMAYANLYEIKSDYGWTDLVALCDSVTNHGNNLSSVVDMDRVIWMLAFNNLLVNLDSYSGAFCQNYYVFKDNTGHYNPVVWDLNMAFGGFVYVGNSNSSMGSLSVVNMQQLPLNIHASDVYWPLINVVMADPVYKNMYVAHMRTMMNEFFVGNQYEQLASQMQQLINQAVLEDTVRFFTYAQFQNGMSGNVTVGSYTVPGISTLMDARLAALQSAPEFMATAPQISGITSSVSVADGMVAVSATVNDASEVYLGYRSFESEKFQRVLMFDDGFHGDGAAGDHRYGINVSMVSSSGQFYIYANNATAGAFSPARAEHEFYRVTPATGGVGGIAAQVEVFVYPNPVSQQLTLACTNQTALPFVLYNAIGQQVSAGEIKGSAIVDVAGLPAGMYFLQAGNFSRRVSVVH